MMIKLGFSRVAIAGLLCCLWGSAVLGADSSKKANEDNEADTDKSYLFVPVITKVEGFGGALTEGWPSNKWVGQGGVVGSVVVPFSDNYAVQFDGLLGAEQTSLAASLTGHAYWYDSKKGLIGLYGSGEYRGMNSGEGILQLGGEGNIFLNQFTLAGIAGVETQADGSRANPSTSGYNGAYGYGFGYSSSYGYGYGAFDGKGNLYETDDFRPNFFNQTRFFDHAEIGYYPIDDLKFTVAHEYSGGFHAAVLDVEYLFGTGSGTAPAIFAEGSIGEHGNASVLAGLRFYFGEEDKSLIRRHREDDPTTHVRRSLTTSASLHSRHGEQMIPIQLQSSQCSLGSVC